MHSASGGGPVFRWGVGLRRVGLTQAYRAGQPVQSHWANFAQPDHANPTGQTSHSMTHLAIHGSNEHLARRPRDVRRLWAASCSRSFLDAEAAEAIGWAVPKIN